MTTERLGRPRELDSFTRLQLSTLLGELLTGAKGTYQVQKEFGAIMADEKTRSYEIGVADGKAGKWGPVR